MFEIRINRRKNAILCILQGRLSFDDAERYAKKVREGIARLKPGYTVISDLTDYTPSQDDARAVLQEAIEFSIAGQSGRVIRIVSDSVGAQVGNIQFTRAARQQGYQVEVVSSLAEAQALLS
jgi:hypothetical protein